MAAHRKPPSESKDDFFWRLIEELFHRHIDTLTFIRFETRDETLSDTRRQKIDNDIVFLMRYRKTVDYKLLNKQIAAGKAAISKLMLPIERRELTPEFTFRWGLLCEAASAVNTLYFSGPGDDLVQERAGRKGAEANHRLSQMQKRWVARLLKEAMDEGLNRKRAQAHVALKAGEFARKAGERFPSNWFAGILNQDELRTAYDIKHLSNKEITRLADLPADELPPTEIDL